MKKIIYISVILVLAFSCSKEDNFIQKVDSHEFCGTVSPVYFWFTGVLKDTSSGNNLIGYTINSVFSSSGSVNYTDTISDSTYFFRIETYGINDSTNNEVYNQIYIKNTSNVLIDSFVFPVSIWIANDTATYDYSF